MSQMDYGAAPRNSTQAVVSLVAGILGLSLLPGIASIVAIIVGNMAQKEIRESAGSIGGEGMARIGIILGWIGVALGLLGVCCFLIFAFVVPFLAITTVETSMLPLLLAGPF